MANLVVWGFSWGPETEYVATFLHEHVCSASLHYPMLIRAIDPVCPKAILPIKVMLCRMLYVTNIPLRNCNDTLFCSELNGNHADDSFVRLRFISFEIY